MPRIRQFAIAVVVLACTATGAVAHPALWLTRSSTATVYLFGTMHVLPKGTHWRFLALDRALTASQALYVEQDNETRATTLSMILKYGVNRADLAEINPILDFRHVYPRHLHVFHMPYLLSRQLDASDQAELRVAAHRTSLPYGVAGLETMQPWLAALTLSTTATKDAGYVPKFGADAELERQFHNHHKPVRAFETAQEQIALFADAPRSLQLQLLEAVLGQRAQPQDSLAKLATDWMSGNANAVAAIVDGGTISHYPALYTALVVDRNRDFARRIDALLNRHGTFFVAIGAGHLAGPSSVQAQLRTLGIHTQRVH